MQCRRTKWPTSNLQWKIIKQAQLILFFGRDFGGTKPGRVVTDQLFVVLAIVLDQAVSQVGDACLVMVGRWRL